MADEEQATPQPQFSGLSPETLAHLNQLEGVDKILGDYFKEPPKPTDSFEQRGFENSPSLLKNPYVEGEAYGFLEAMPAEFRIQIQQTLKALGVITGNVSWGEVGDPATIKGFNELLAMSNAAGTRWTATLQRLQNTATSLGFGSGSGGGGGGGRMVPAYVAPDPATLAQTVKQNLRQRLGRDPQQEELDALSAELSSFAKQAYDSQVAAAQGAATTDVDPQARFQELIESKYANELQMLDDRDDVAYAKAATQRQTSFIDRVLGGA